MSSLLSYCIVALSLGLRHGLDADHIVVIDNITRNLSGSRKNNAFTGLYFALGHSTIVFILTFTLVLGINNSTGFYNWLSVVGSSVGGYLSIGFLVFTLLINLVAINNLRLSQKSNAQVSPDMASRGGLIFNLLNKYVLTAINSSRKMFFVGVLLGLGFDTATEIGLLSIAASGTLNGYSLWIVLLLPILFALGMIFTDTTNSILMSKVYNWCKKRNIFLYNYCILGFATLITLIVIIVELVNGVESILVGHSQLIHAVGFLADNSWLIGVSAGLGFALLFAFIYLNYRSRVYKI